MTSLPSHRRASCMQAVDTVLHTTLDVQEWCSLWSCLLPSEAARQRCVSLRRGAAERTTLTGRRLPRWRGRRLTDGRRQLAAALNTAGRASPAACLRWARATPQKAAAMQLSWRSRCMHRCRVNAGTEELLKLSAASSGCDSQQCNLFASQGACSRVIICARSLCTTT